MTSFFFTVKTLPPHHHDHDHDGHHHPHDHPRARLLSCEGGAEGLDFGANPLDKNPAVGTKKVMRSLPGMPLPFDRKFCFTAVAITVLQELQEE